MKFLKVIMAVSFLFSVSCTTMTKNNTSSSLNSKKTIRALASPAVGGVSDVVYITKKIPSTNNERVDFKELFQLLDKECGAEQNLLIAEKANGREVYGNYSEMDVISFSQAIVTNAAGDELPGMNRIASAVCKPGFGFSD